MHAGLEMWKELENEREDRYRFHDFVALRDDQNVLTVSRRAFARAEPVAHEVVAAFFVVDLLLSN
jgi:hypothetical protein